MLISLPWADHTRPSGAIGALTAFLRRELPRHEVVPLSRHAVAAAAIGFDLYERIAADCYGVGEPLSMSICYPERAAAVREQFVSWAAAKLGDRPPSDWVDGAADFAAVFDHVRGALDAEIDEVAALAAPEGSSDGDGDDDGGDVVGLSTCFGQLFANIALARRVKRRRPGARVVLGGSTISSRVGPSILAEYPEIDFVVQGEGERPLAALVDSFATGAPPPERGVVTRGGSPAPLWEVERMDDLPVPDFDEYARLAEEQGILWWLPIEGSRGCWWDRTKRAGNPKATCYFCNLNVQWSGYREKSIGRVVGELEELTRRYEVTQVYFLDNIIRHRVDELARGIAGIERDLEIFYEMRANVTPYELLLMWEAGLVRVQFGIEGLSSSFLRRIGKGTSVIQNLQVMKVCHELGIANGANLITDFPGSTAAEVEETCRNIESFAIAYEPCQPSPFTLGVDATVDTLHAEFGVEAIRNDWSARLGLPEEVWRRLRLFSLDFDCAGAEVSWAPVLAAIEAWQARRREIGGPLLTYHDGTSFLRVTDRRHGHDVITLHGPHRALYLDCMEIERRDRLLARHAGSGVDAEAIIDDLSAAKLLFEEDGKLLALATAPSARAAARRIRADAQARQNAARARGFGGRLPVVVG